MRDPSELRTADDVDAMASALYSAPLPFAEGVVHVTAVAKEGERRTVIAIGPHAPKSGIDFFILNLTRARVDAIVVSGSVLRAEPELRYELGGATRALSAWRARHTDTPPWLLVLSRGDLSAEHPVWDSWARPLVYVPDDAVSRLRAVLPARVEVVGAARPSARGAIAHLRADRGCRAVSIEAGPRVAVPLYDEPLAIDELLLSVYGGELDPAARAGAFLDESELSTRLERRAATAVGEWTFSRWLGRRGSAGGSG
ncbi:MAG: hypothetical protein AB7S26_33920 [Sandaracinaceae bacterium]